MNKYCVELHCVVEIEAGNADDAVDEALELDPLRLVWDADVISSEEGQ